MQMTQFKIHIGRNSRVYVQLLQIKNNGPWSNRFLLCYKEPARFSNNWKTHRFLQLFQKAIR